MGRQVFSRAEILKRAKVWCETRYRIILTGRMVRDWGEQNLVPPPNKIYQGYGKGSRSEWTSLQYRTICKICRFKGHGIKDYDRIRMLLWLNGKYIPISELRGSCLKVLEKIIKSKAFSPRSQADLSNPELSAKTRESIAKAAGHVDRRLVPEGFEYTQAEAIEMIAMLKTGDLRQSFVSHYVKEAIAFKIPENGELKQINEMFVGLLGSEGEIEETGLHSIKHASAHQFVQAKRELRKQDFSLGALSKMPLPEAIKTQFSTALMARFQPEFRPLFFISLLHIVFKNKLPKTPEIEELHAIIQYNKENKPWDIPD